MKNTDEKISRPRIDVLCLTYGEPKDNVFKPQFQYSLNILNKLTRRVAPIPRFITPLLAARRARIRVRDFSADHFNSPLEFMSHKQVEQLQKTLSELRPDADFQVHLVMEFREPNLFQVLGKIRQNPGDELVLLPLYVAESDFTTGISRTDLKRFNKKNRDHQLPEPAYVGGFGFDERMGKLLADHVWLYCQQHGWNEEKCKESALLMGAHGTLQSPPPGINSGALETRFLFGQIRKHLLCKFKTVRLGWLNHTLGGQWTSPAVEKAAMEVQSQGIDSIVYFPFGFMADTNESQREGKIALNNFSWNSLLYLPCPNGDDGFIKLLSLMVLERLENPKREKWHQIEEGARQDLIQKERPVVQGKPGLLKFSGPVLGVIAALFWVMGGVMMMRRGVKYIQQVDNTVLYILTILFSCLIFWFKGRFIMGKVMKRNLVRLRRIPQPSFVLNFFSKPLWFFMVFFSLMGVALRLTPLPASVHAVALLGIGGALLHGSYICLRNLKEAKPVEKV